jgi:hypothetical protein
VIHMHNNFSRRPRHCCEGRCASGQRCPAFAPGVLEIHRAQRTWRLVALWVVSGLVVLGVTLVACGVSA